MPNLKLAVISDLHIGHKVRSKDLCPYADNNRVEENYLSNFIRFVQTNNIRADYLIVPGDVTGTAHPEEFKLASEAIINIGQALGVAEERILFVPGNHDKDWHALPQGEVDTTGVRAAQMYAPLKHNAWLFERVLRRSPHYILSDPCLAIWEFDNLIVVGYNSSMHDDRNAEIHHGLVANESLDWLNNQLQNIDLGNQRIKVFLVHHHPIQYSNHIPDTPDFSVMTNAENLLKLLGTYEFDLVLHGHRHMPHFNTHSINLNSPIAILGAGSFSYQLEMSYNGHVSNQFHLLEIEGRDDQTERMYGLLKNWSFLSGHGWKPSEKHDGILHRIGFGTYSTFPVLKKVLTPKIQTLFMHASYVKWSDLVLEDNKLDYLPPECVSRLLKEIGEEQGYECHGDNPDTAILLLPRRAV